MSYEMTQYGAHVVLRISFGELVSQEASTGAAGRFDNLIRYVERLENHRRV